MKALVFQQHYGSDIDNKLEIVKRKSERFERLAGVNLHHRVGDAICQLAQLRRDQTDTGSAVNSCQNILIEHGNALSEHGYALNTIHAILQDTLQAILADRHNDEVGKSECK